MEKLQSEVEGRQLRISLPYGRSTVYASVSESMNVSLATPRKWRKDPAGNPVTYALQNPMGSPRLRELAKGCHSAVIVTCDKTRGVPSRATIPALCEELRNAGMSMSHVRILVATGLHKDETMADVVDRLGVGVAKELTTIIHDSDDPRQLVHLGRLSSGVPLWLNRTAAQSDLVVVESTVEPHFFAGFTGGSKVILPGAAGTQTILGNHRFENIDDARSRYGVLENPVRLDANESLRYLKKTYGLNIVLDNRKRVVYATSGDAIASFDAAAKIVDDHSRVRVQGSPHAVITTNGGYPLDRNIYQCVKGIAVPESVLAPTSKIIMVGECIDGVAHPQLLRLLASAPPDVLYERMRESKSAIPDQWQAQVLCRILKQNTVWFVTRSELRSEIESMHMRYAPTVERALVSAARDDNDQVLVVPDGPMAILTSQIRRPSGE